MKAARIEKIMKLIKENEQYWNIYNNLVRDIESGILPSSALEEFYSVVEMFLPVDEEAILEENYSVKEWFEQNCEDKNAVLVLVHFLDDLYNPHSTWLLIVNDIEYILN